jgi:hypothetical protein
MNRLHHHDPFGRRCAEDETSEYTMKFKPYMKTFKNLDNGINRARDKTAGQLAASRLVVPRRAQGFRLPVGPTLRQHAPS